MAVDHQAERQHFEKAAYAVYFDGAMRANNQGPLSITIATGVLTQHEFFALDEKGCYTNPQLQVGWGFWQKRAVLDTSGDLFAVLEDAHAALSAQMDVPAADRGEIPLQELRGALGAFIASIRAQAS